MLCVWWLTFFVSSPIAFHIADISFEERFDLVHFWLPPSLPPSPSEKLSDCLKLQRHPTVSSEVFLSFRVLLLRFSPTHLLSFWPAIVAETVRLPHLNSTTAAVPLMFEIFYFCVD